MKKLYGKQYMVSAENGKMYATVAVVLMFLLSGLVLNVTAQSKEQDKAYRVDEFKTSSVEAINVETFGGSIEVHGTDKTMTIVEMYVKKGDRYLDEDEIDLSDYDINIDLDRGKLVAIADKKGLKSSWNSNISIGFKVSGPQKANLDLKTSGGPILTENVEGRHELKTSGGPLTMTGMKGKLQASTSGGPVTLNSSEGEISAKTSGGPIYANNSSGSIELKTSGGPIKLRNLSGQISARTSGGSIDADISKLEENLNLQTSGGDITVNLPEGAGYNLQATGGRVLSELRGFNGTTENDKIEGEVNGGGPNVKLMTSAGQVKITQ